MEVTKLNGDVLNKIVKYLAHEKPDFNDLPEELQQKIASAALADEYKATIQKLVDAEKVNYPKEREHYLTTLVSKHTRRAYRSALDRFDGWCQSNGHQPVTLTPAAADDFIYALKAERMAAASIRRDVAAVSAYFTWLDRRYSFITNPFRGTRARPKRMATKTVRIPDAKEMDAIIDYFSGSTRAAVITMSGAGLRVGSLPSLTIREGRYTCETKGREQKGKLTPEILKALKPLGGRPFADRTAGGIAESFRYGIKVLIKTGTIQAEYSVHDLRHYFAVTEYSRDHDIYRVSKLLGHSNVTITQNYLKGLDVINE